MFNQRKKIESRKTCVRFFFQEGELLDAAKRSQLKEETNDS